jgi:Fe-Mn family superoxide dismutase
MFCACSRPGAAEPARDDTSANDAPPTIRPPAAYNAENWEIFGTEPPTRGRMRRTRMAYQQAPLPYAYNALEPHIDARTMEIHYTKHHAAYVANVNKALEGHPDLANLSVEQLIGSLDKVPEAIRTTVRNNGGGHANHTLFWELMSPGAGGPPTGAIADAIASAFGSFDNFKTQFSQAGMGRFGSGWAWLIADKTGALSIMSTPNQDSPTMEGKKPVLGLDVWEHAYYLLYQNRRADYIAAWWNVVNWRKVAELYAAARS